MAYQPTAKEIKEAKIQLALEAAEAVKTGIRNKIKVRSGDVESLLGTTADAVQILLVSMAELLIAIGSATTISQIKAAAAGNGMAVIAPVLMADIKSGAVKMPYQLKGGVAAVMPGIKSRANSVSLVLSGK